jgi:hypothetical protein
LPCSIKPPGEKSGRDGEASTFLAEGDVGFGDQDLLENEIQITAIHHDHDGLIPRIEGE